MRLEPLLKIGDLEPSLKRTLLSPPNGKVAAPSFNLPSVGMMEEGQFIVICKRAWAERLDCLSECYAANIEEFRKNTYKSYVKNYHESFEENFQDKIRSEIVYSYGEYDAFRIHCGGEFFDREYFEKWVSIARKIPGVMFWAYTKEKELGVLPRPKNFVLIFSSDIGKWEEKPEGFNNIAFVVRKKDDVIKTPDGKELKANCPYQFDKRIKCAALCTKCLRPNYTKPIVFIKHR